MLTAGKVVHLKCISTGKNLRLRQDGNVDGQGGNGEPATWIVSPSNGHIRFQNKHAPDRYLALRDGQLTFGPGGQWTELIVQPVGNDVIVLRGAYGQGGVGIFPDGSTKPPMQVGEGLCVVLVLPC